MPCEGEQKLRDEVTLADEPAVRALVAATGMFNSEEIDIAAELVRTRALEGAECGYEFVVEDGPEGLVGYACWGRVEGTRNSYDLYWIAVASDRQGRGCGRRLLAAAEARIATAGGGTLWLDTAGRDDYRPTRAFYRACGYEEQARLRDFYSPGDDKVIFARRIAAA
ncbi:MAG: GNAT family N-acetyltransferase [Acidobacteriota bacterium]|nr:GNAT family N-acetyltransferase [Acidobacteriota bacterium]